MLRGGPAAGERLERVAPGHPPVGDGGGRRRGAGRQVGLETGQRRSQFVTGVGGKATRALQRLLALVGAQLEPRKHRV